MGIFLSRQKQIKQKEYFYSLPLKAVFLPLILKSYSPRNKRIFFSLFVLCDTAQLKPVTVADTE